MQTEIKKSQKKHSDHHDVNKNSDYAAIGSGSNGIGSMSWSSRQLARGLPPRGKEEDDNNSTPVAFDVNDGNGGKVEVNGEYKGNSNSNGPVDNNNNNNYNIDNDNKDNNGGAGRTEAQTWDNCGGAGGDGGKGGEGGGCWVCEVLEQEE